MRPQYIVVAGVPVIVPLNNNSSVFNVSVRGVGGQTVEATLEDPPPDGPVPIWVAVAASPLGANFYSITVPVRMLRITGAGTATVLQQGV